MFMAGVALHSSAAVQDDGAEIAAKLEKSAAEAKAGRVEALCDLAVTLALKLKTLQKERAVRHSCLRAVVRRRSRHCLRCRCWSKS
jgi:hypothetical protein